MNIENLEIGMKIKYKKLCELLGIEPKEGNSRKKQFKEIDKLIEYHKEGQLFVIDKIFRTTEPTNNDILNIYKNNNAEFVGENRTGIIEQKHSFWHTPNYDNWNVLFSDLSIGESYNTIKEICKEVNITYDIKNPIRSLELIQQLYRIEKEDNKYIIKEKYLIPIEKVDFRVDKQTAWTMGNVLLSLMYNNARKGSIYTFFSYGQLYKYAQMYNENYEKYKFNRERLAKLNDMEVRVINDFYNVTNGVFKSNVKKGLKNLDNRCLAFATEGIAICEEVFNEEHGRYEEIHRLANDYEISVILEHEKKALRFFNFSTKKMVWEKHMFIEFYNKVCEGIQNEGVVYKECSFANMKYYYKCVKLIHCYENTKIDYYEELEKKIIKEAKEQSSKKVTESKRYDEEIMKPLKEQLLD